MTLRKWSESNYWWGDFRFSPSASFLWPFRTVTRLSGGGAGMMLPVLLLFLFIMNGSAAADATLEILNLKFPEKCGAVYNENITTCTRCHSSPLTAAEEVDRENKSPSLMPRRTVTSLEEKERITVSVPAKTLEPGQPFIQEIRFKGSRIYYQYGYRRDRGPFHELDAGWIRGLQRTRFVERHNGKSLPLLSEPGEYVFMVKLLYDRIPDPKSYRFRWEEVVFLWTLSVGKGG